MKILGIDTSCDDTCIAIIETGDRQQATGDRQQLLVDGRKSKLKILSNIVSSQIKVHQKYGGVYPSLAKREHQRNLVPVLKQASKKSNLLMPNAKCQMPKSKIKVQKLKKILEREPILAENLIEFFKRYSTPKISAIAVTIGPGLEPCLWQGINFAKALSFFWEKPIIPVNHIEAHIAANFIGENPKYQITNYKQINFPAICLVASGGHTELILMKNYGKYEILGETRDDAAGECLDKTARILGLSYPGGPAIEKLTKRYPLNAKRYKIKLPRPMIYQKNCDFSFSGLKTAVLYDFKKRQKKTRISKKYIQEMCIEIQQVVIDVLIKKTKKAAKEFKAKTILIGGGVASNKEFKKQFKEKIKKDCVAFNIWHPKPKLCADNAAMVAAAGYFGWLKKKQKNWKKIEANANLKIANR